MATRRTPAELVKLREDELAKSRRKLARAKDPAILDLEHLRDDLIAWGGQVQDENNCLESAAQVLDSYITDRIDRALAAE